MTKLICDRPQLSGAYGTVTLGQEFEVTDDMAPHFLSNGLAHRKETPKVAYETKVIVPGITVGAEAPEVGPRLPFRDVSMHHAQSEGMATEGDSVLPVADLPKPESADRFGRRGRKGSDT